MFNLQCIIGLHSKIIEFTNDFPQADIPSGEPVFIELFRDFKSDGGHCDVVLRLKKILYGQAEISVRRNFQISLRSLIYYLMKDMRRRGPNMSLLTSTLT